MPYQSRLKDVLVHQEHVHGGDLMLPKIASVVLIYRTSICHDYQKFCGNVFKLGY